MKLTLSSLLFILITACSSVPISSLLKMASFDNNMLLSINPSEVRVRLSITAPAELKTKDVSLALKFEHESEEDREYKYQLKLIDTQRLNSVSSWFSSQPEKHSYSFKLADLSKLEFNRLQKELAQFGTPDKYYWTVYYFLKKRLPKGREIEIDLELKLGHKEEFFYLLKNAMVEVNS